MCPRSAVVIPGTGVLPPAVLWQDTILLWEYSQQAWIMATGQHLWGSTTDQMDMHHHSIGMRRTSLNY